MKKSLVITLALVFVLGIAGTAFAANPFVDVPANHWAYGAVAKLAKAGIVDGMGDGTFQGNREMTRYEMAQIVAKAMAKSDKADAANKALIEKLEAEFAVELNNLGVRVSALEKKVGTVKVSGDARIRYQDNFDLKDEKNDRWQERVRLYLNADVANNVEFAGRLQAQWTSGDKNANNTNDVSVDRAKFIFKNVMSRSNFEIGRDTLFLGQGLLADTAGGYDMAKITFGNKLKGFVAYGDAAPLGGKIFASNYVAAKPATIAEDPDHPGQVITVPAVPASGEKTANIAVANLSYDIGKLNVTGAYIYPTANRLDNYRMWAIGTNYRFDPTWAVTAEYAKSDANTEDTGYWAKLNYKGANKAKVGSWGLYVDYRDIDANAIDGGLTTLCAMDNTNGVKGFGYGFNYTLAKNAVLTGIFEDLENAKTGKDHDTYTYVKVEFNF